MGAHSRFVGRAAGLAIVMLILVGVNGLAVAASRASTDASTLPTVREDDAVTGHSMCPADAAEIMPKTPATILVELPAAGVWSLSMASTNPNKSAFEGSLEVVGYGTYSAPTTDSVEYYLGEITVDAPTVLEILVNPIGRISVCVTIEAELVPVVTTTVTTTTAAPATTATSPPTTSAAPLTTTTTSPPETTTVAPPSATSSTVLGRVEVLAGGPPPPTLPVTGLPAALLAASGIAAVTLGALATGLSRRR